MRQYTPRRASKRWLEGAPDYVLDCFDTKDCGDRYTVVFGKEFMNHVPNYPGGDYWLSYLAMSDAPTHPQGISLWGEMASHQIAAYRYRNHHRRVRWNDLPEHIREHVVARAEED